ncbi:MAG: hypothetical protein ACE5I5_17670 [Candidatus Heimdallarchaeota archaeon]
MVGINSYAAPLELQPVLPAVMDELVHPTTLYTIDPIPIPIRQR